MMSSIYTHGSPTTGHDLLSPPISDVIEHPEGRLSPRITAVRDPKFDDRLHELVLQDEIDIVEKLVTGKRFHTSMSLHGP